MRLTANELRPILDELFPSAEMAAYLARCPVGDDGASPGRPSLRRSDLAQAVAGAPISLERKRQLLSRLAEGEEDGFFSSLAGRVQRALEETRAGPGEFFYLKCHCYDADAPFSRELALEPYLTWERISGRIREYLGDLDAGERELTWFQVEKWSPDGAGGLKNDYDYTVLDTEACYFRHGESVEFDINRDLYLPVPFRAGDIVTADCRPFLPPSRAVILEVADNRDCCSLQALYREGGDSWSAGAVKHGHIFPNRRLPGLSPLYRMSTFRAQLPDTERLLQQVSRHVTGDESRGAALGNYIFDLKYGAREERTVTQSQILSHIDAG